EAARREKRIGSSLEAKVVLFAENKTRALLEQHAAELPTLLIVSQVELAKTRPEGATASEGPLSGDGLAVEVKPADGAKCPRCWTYSLALTAGRPVCDKCAEAL